MESVVLYMLVAAVFVVPVVLWKREEADLFSGEAAGGRVENLPGLFKRFWRPALLLEGSLGMLAARLTAGGADEFEKLRAASALPLTYARIGSFRILFAFLFAAPGILLLVLPKVNPAYGSAFAGAGALFGWFFPVMTLRQYVDWRKTELTRALPFAIDLMGSAMRAGLEFTAAMRYFIGLGVGGPIQDEFSFVLRQMELGKTRGEALQDMATRVQIDAFTSFVGVIVYGTEIGASIVETLKMQGEDLRRARFNIAERKAARAPSLMILPMALFIMPAVFIIVVTPIVMQMRATGLGAH